jgi:hypothetical protein
MARNSTPCWLKRNDGPEQPERADGYDRKWDGEQHLDTGNHHSPIDVDSFLRDRRIPAARLIDIDGSVVSPAPRRRPIPLFCACHSASIAWN